MKKSSCLLGIFFLFLCLCMTACSLHIHSWEYATCTDPKTCSKCGETAGEPLGHKIPEYEIIQEATCSSEGMQKGTCNLCGEQVVEPIPATGNHELSDTGVILSEPTCTKTGKCEYTCLVCGETVSEVMETLPHVNDNNWVITKAPSATASGQKATHCSVCGAVVQTITFDLSMEEKQAIGTAERYLKIIPFSRSGLIEQLEYEGFSTKDATFAVDNIVVDWNEQAAEKAKSYLSIMSFSKSGLIDQLMFEGFTKGQAEYGVKAVGY